VSCGAAANRPLPVLPERISTSVGGIHLFSPAATAPRPQLYSLSVRRGSMLSPATEGQRMYHPTVSSPITRRIWGSPDAILLFFAGGAAEFAAIKAVDWLFFTGRLPGAPVERFFETVRFAQRVFFGDPAGATEAIERINRIHRHVEQARGEEIPQWAYRDMLFILIDYGERAHEVVFGPLTEAERASHFGVALALGRAMHLSGLPTTYAEYRAQRHQQLLEDYARGPLTDELYASYRRALGPLRFGLLRLVQASVLPGELRDVLRLEPHPLVDQLLRCYRFMPGGGNKLRPLHNVLLPGRFAKQLRQMERTPDGR
jgi:ER-bound oxygenase mpaB/B'/Rubber oxygenase, catalytic domain